MPGIIGADLVSYLDESSADLFESLETFLTSLLPWPDESSKDTLAESRDPRLDIILPFLEELSPDMSESREPVLTSLAEPLLFREEVLFSIEPFPSPPSPPPPFAHC